VGFRYQSGVLLQCLVLTQSATTIDLQFFRKEEKPMVIAQNVLGTELQVCSTSPMTGYFRDGCCNTGGGDFGAHVVCAQVTAEFLDFTRSRGNDLSTPNPMFNFPGLKPGDRWCLCAARWQEAMEAGAAPPVVLEATHISALEHVSLADLKQYAVISESES
jgi:uncharacterized protein (DUF2237 family)